MRPLQNYVTIEKGARIHRAEYYTWREQPPPRKRPLPRDYIYCRMETRSSSDTFTALNPDAYWPMIYSGDHYSEPDVERVRNAALRKFDDELRIVDSFFEDWYERQQAIDMATKAAKELLYILRNFRKPNRLWKRYRKGATPSSLPEAWLAYHFGIKPLVGTISRSLDGLGAEFPRRRVKHRSKGKGRLSLYWNDYHGGGGYPFGWNVDIQATIATVVTGVNPNTGLLGATGLNEPFSSAWSVIPWGWAVDYFVNVGELISNFENKHPGLILSDSYHSITLDGDFYLANRFTKDINPFYDMIGDWRAIEAAKSAVFGRMFKHKRYDTIPKYSLEYSYPPLGGNQLAHLLSAISLTVKGKK